MFLQGTGDVLISYENEAINFERQGKPVEHVNPPQTFKIENPVAVVTSSAAPGPGQRAEELPVHPGGPEDLGRRPASGPVDPVGRRGLRRRLPDTAEAVDHRRPGWLERGRPGVVRQGQRHHHQDLQAGHWMTAVVDPNPEATRPELTGDGGAGPPRASSGAGTAPRRCGSVSAIDLAVRHRAAAAGRDPVAVRRRRLGRVLAGGHVERGHRVVPGDADHLGRRHAGQPGLRAAGRVGADARRLSRQAPGRRGHRPAVRAADDRRQPGDAGALRAEQPGRHSPPAHQVGRRHRAAVRHAAVRGAFGAAGAAGTRPRGRGGRGLARRQQLRRSSPR